jgi:DNA processing protein
MGWENAHEVVLALVESEAASASKISRMLRSMPADRVSGLDLGCLLEDLGAAETGGRKAAPLRRRAAGILKRLAGDGVTVVVLGEPGYPSLLREIADPPPMLFIRGSVVPEDSAAVAVVGSRRPTLAGSEIARTLAAGLGRAGFTTVSGLARGIDTAAHRGALDAGARTIAVLGSGIDNVYPPDNRGLADAVAAAGAVVSEFIPGCGPLRYNFPRRNRVISGLALGTVVVEAGEKSGALITAACALDENRSVYAVPGAPGHAKSRGANNLIKQGAKLVESASDVLEDLAPEIAIAKARPSLNFAPDLSHAERRVVGLLSDTPLHVDEVSRHLGMQSGAVLCVLLSLETKGLVRGLPGKFYVREGSLECLK